MDREDWLSRRKLEKPNAKWPTCLIIAPNTVVLNWEREFEKWGYFEVGVYAGPDRADILRDFKYGRLDVVVTSFQVATRDIDLLDTLDWSCIIVDEVHQAKNVQSKVSNALHQFTCVRRFGLTGTTIQNSYKEMWSILDWTNPGKLGTLKQWDTLVAKPLAVGQSVSATPEEQAFSHHVAQTLRNEFLPNFFLRRTKDIIKDQLPTKHDNVVFCPLTPMQIEAYKRILALDAVRNFLDRDKDCPCGSKKARQKCCHPFVVGDVFKFMSILLKLSNHLALILPGNPNDSPEQIVRNRELAAAIFPNGTPIYELAIMQPQYCGKWMALEALLAEWRQDPLNKILIFTKSVKLLDMFEFNLNKKRETGYKHLTLSGTTPKDKRMDLIEQFNNDPSVKIFLISIQTGGTGLNLIGANKVVIFDPNWNPAHDMQAMDRAFRFGQTRDVSVYRLLGAGSIEELIYARQIYKQQQMKIAYDASVQTRYFQGVQGDNSNKGELFGLENIFKLHEGELATKRTIERANLAELDWALANLVPAPQKSKHAGKTTGPSKGGSVDDTIREQLAEASGKFQNDDFLGNAKGLSSLLFDERIPDTEHEKIQKTLNQIGVAYSHKNDEILVPSKIEEARTKELIKKSRQKRLEAVERKTAIKEKKGKEKAKERQPSPPKPIWPPIRKHHKLKPPPPTPQEQLQSRRKALIRLELIRSPADLPSFASEFAKMSEEEQRTTIAQLDDYMANNPCSDSESSS
ncbi:hypothetical protein CPC08DRAFT_557075 [Agrocybe pediades]|nr:hypothetical protein CPC08DRAFT_557075 [Agrocybe pediades]